MSLAGNINKISGDVRRAVDAMARQGVTSLDGTVRGTRKIFGYVCEIHEDGDLAGTIDVQEFDQEPGEGMVVEEGLHKGVFLSAIQENKDGFLVVPMLYSEVVICQNPLDGQEYVLMYSHAKRIQMLSRSTEDSKDGEIEIGVTEVEKFTETDEGLDKDFDELEPTKNKTSTLYTATSITDQVSSPDDEKGYKEEKTASKKTISVGDTVITVDGQNISIKTSGKVNIETEGDANIKASGNVNMEADGNAVIKANDAKIEASTVTITGGTLKTKGASNTDLQGPFNAIKACPFSGAPHCGSTVSGT